MTIKLDRKFNINRIKYIIKFLFLRMIYYQHVFDNDDVVPTCPYGKEPKKKHVKEYTGVSFWNCLKIAE